MSDARRHLAVLRRTRTSRRRCPDTDEIQISGSTPAYSYTLQFGAPVTNPVLELGSLGSRLDFPAGTQITRLSGDSGFAVQRQLRDRHAESDARSRRHQRLERDRAARSARSSRSRSPRRIRPRGIEDGVYPRSARSRHRRRRHRRRHRHPALRRRPRRTSRCRTSRRRSRQARDRRHSCDRDRGHAGDPGAGCGCVRDAAQPRPTPGPSTPRSGRLPGRDDGGRPLHRRARVRHFTAAELDVEPEGRHRASSRSSTGTGTGSRC